MIKIFGGQTTERTRRGEQYSNLIGKAGEEVFATTRSRKMNWTEIVKTNMPDTRIIEAIKDKIQQLKTLLDSEQAQVIEEPHTVVVYVRNTRRGPIGAMRNALRQSLPSWPSLD